jgi:hypothetical protein
MIAFPCGPWGPLLRLNQRVNLHEIQAEGEVLLKFALELAAIQADGGVHYLLENPQPSGAWKHPEMAKFLDEHDHHLACFHQCRFGLRGNIGLHQRPRKLPRPVGLQADFWMESLALAIMLTSQ